MDVLDTEGSFVGHRSGRQSAICQGGELAGDVDCVRGTDGLGVRTRYCMGRCSQLGLKIVVFRWDGKASIPGQASLVWMGVMSAISTEVEVWWMVLLTLCAWI